MRAPVRSRTLSPRVHSQDPRNFGDAPGARVASDKGWLLRGCQCVPRRPFTQCHFLADHDVPTQQELLAQFRCGEISAMALAEFSEQVKSQKRPLEGLAVEGPGAMMNTSIRNQVYVSCLRPSVFFSDVAPFADDAQSNDSYTLQDSFKMVTRSRPPIFAATFRNINAIPTSCIFRGCDTRNLSGPTRRPAVSLEGMGDRHTANHKGNTEFGRSAVIVSRG